MSTDYPAAWAAGIVSEPETFVANPQELLAAAGLSAHALNDPEGTVPYSAMGLLLQIAAERTGCPHFGIEVGKTVRTASLGLLGELMRNSPTVRVALKDFAFHQHINASWRRRISFGGEVSRVFRIRHISGEGTRG